MGSILSEIHWRVTEVEYEHKYKIRNNYIIETTGFLQNLLKNLTLKISGSYMYKYNKWK